MANHQELLKNLSELKKCEKVYKWVAIIYICICVPTVFASFYFILLGVNGDPIKLFFNALFKIAELAAGYLGCYQKDKRFVFAELFLAVLNLIVSVLGFIFLLISILLSILTLTTNKKYHFLEQQEGFPHFNERFEKQKADSIQFNIKNPYQQRLEEIQKTSSDAMDSVSLSSEKLDKKIESANNYMDEV